MSEPIPVIVNAASGAGHSDADLERLRGLFREAGLEARILVAGNGVEIHALAREAMQGRHGVVVAEGGDGTSSAVADAVRGTDTALGVIALGTANHFPRDLGIPVDAAEAVRVIAAGHRTAIDVGEVNGISFVNNSSLGLYPGIVRERVQLQRRLRRGKRSAMIWAILAVLRRAPLLHLHVRLGDREGELRSPFVFIGNNEYTMEGFDIGSRERLDGGILSVYTTARSTARGLFALAMRALFGRLRQAKDFTALQARAMRIESTHEHLLVATDGEVRRMKTPLDYVIVPRSLQVLVP